MTMRRWVLDTNVLICDSFCWCAKTTICLSVGWQLPVVYQPGDAHRVTDSPRQTKARCQTEPV